MCVCTKQFTLTIDKCFLFFFRIDEIDCHQHVSLAKLNGDVLNVKVPCEQVKPHIAGGDLHKSNSKEVKEEQGQSTGQSDAVTSKTPKAQLQTSIENIKNKNDVVCCGERKCKKDQLDHFRSHQLSKYKDTANLLPVIKSGEWLTYEHIDNAQAILVDNFPYIGGQQATRVFISEECQLVGTPEHD